MIRTVEDLFVAWPALAESVRGRAGRSDETIERTLRLAKPFRVSFGARLLVPFAEGGAADVARWATSHRGAGRYARTIMGDAVLLGLVPLSPFAGVGGLTRASGRNFIPTRAQIEALAAAGERYGLDGWVRVGAYSGARLGALAHLQTRDVATTGRTWRLQLLRKGRPGRYPAVLLPEGVAALAPLLPVKRTEYVFRRPKGGQWDRGAISRCWVKMRRELGLPEDCTAHSTRKFFATHLVDSGLSFEDTAIALDHVDRDGRPNTEFVRTIYSRPDRDAALQRVAGVAA